MVSRNQGKLVLKTKIETEENKTIYEDHEPISIQFSLLIIFLENLLNQFLTCLSLTQVYKGL